MKEKEDLKEDVPREKESGSKLGKAWVTLQWSVFGLVLIGLAFLTWSVIWSNVEEDLGSLEEEVPDFQMSEDGKLYIEDTDWKFTFLGKEVTYQKEGESGTGKGIVLKEDGADIHLYGIYEETIDWEPFVQKAFGDEEVKSALGNDEKLQEVEEANRFIYVGVFMIFWLVTLVAGVLLSWLVMFIRGKRLRIGEVLSPVALVGLVSALASLTFGLILGPVGYVVVTEVVFILGLLFLMDVTTEQTGKGLVVKRKNKEDGSGTKKDS